jgi:hypothetical protein
VKHRKITENTNITHLMLNESTCDADVDVVELAQLVSRVFPQLRWVDCGLDDVWVAVQGLIRHWSLKEYST